MTELMNTPHIPVSASILHSLIMRAPSIPFRVQIFPRRGLQLFTQQWHSPIDDHKEKKKQCQCAHE